MGLFQLPDILLAADHPINLENVLRGIEQRVPELKATRISTGTVIGADVWQGEDNGMAEFGRNMRVAISRYASATEAQEAVEKSLRTRQVAPDPVEIYKGTVLYRFKRYGTVLCQSGPYAIEIDPFSTNATALVMNVLDAMLDELNYHRDVRPSKAASTATLKLKFVSVDSEETNGENGYGKDAVDGDPNTIWHTRWQGESPGLPHEIVIELVPPSIINGFSYLPRQDASDHGNIKDFEFYAGDDGKHFGKPVKTGTFGPGKDEKIETFDPVKCRFIKLKAISEINGLPFTSAAEIRVLRPGEEASTKNYWRGDVGPLPVPQDSTWPDAIDSLVAAFSTNGGLWLNGTDAIDDSQAASPAEVVSQTFRKAKFQTGLMTSYHIMDIRNVRFGELQANYVAVLAETNLGQMIVLMRKSATQDHWWRRIYSAGAPYNRLY
jgi:hypothetical protein